MIKDNWLEFFIMLASIIFVVLLQGLFFLVLDPKLLTADWVQFQVIISLGMLLGWRMTTSIVDPVKRIIEDVKNKRANKQD